MTQIWLDLEATIIESWENPHICNLREVGKFLDDYKCKEIRIFSFAVWNDKDKQEFANYHQGIIERALEVKVMQCPSLDDMIRQILVGQKVHPSFIGPEDRMEFINIWGKGRTFFDWCRLKATENSILLDDVVENEVLIVRDTGLLFETVNVYRI